MSRLRTPRSAVAVVIAALLLTTGCTSTQLRHSTLAHSTTLQDIYTQQVLDNLAMLIADRAALPFFAYPNQGTTAIQDQANVAGPGYVGQRFTTVPLALGGSRQATENWVLVPVSDPAKLALMRCAYQQALASCLGPKPPSFCPDCSELRRNFYGPALTGGGSGAVNTDLPCLNAPCWLVWGCKHKIPKGCGVPYVGFYRGLYVWVCPEGREMLTNLTLTILDYAVNDPKQFQKRTKTVELYVNENGSINYEGKGIKISASIPIDVPSEWVAALDKSPAYAQFLRIYGKRMADHVQALAESIPAFVNLSPADKDRAWEQLNPNDQPWNTDPVLQKAVIFIRDNKIIPRLVPTEEALQGPAAYEHKGAASEGLQQIGQKLNAALAPAPLTGR